MSRSTEWRSGKYWYRIFEQPVEARFVKMEVLSLTNIEWTVINRFSLYGASAIPRLMEHSGDRYVELSGLPTRGEAYWWYTVGHFYGLDLPLIESRSMPWLTWKPDLDGVLLWLLQSSWRGKNTPSRFRPEPGQAMWPSFEVAGHGGHNGIGNLCYPGPNAQPWSSVRLE